MEPVWASTFMLELLKAVCKELFGHIIDSAVDKTHTHGLYSNKEVPQSVFCHLLQHLQENDNNILGLLSCESSEIFLRYFKDSLNELIQTQFINHNRKQNQDLPQEFLVNHISGSFVEMVLWWLKDKKTHTPEELDYYFVLLLSRFYKEISGQQISPGYRCPLFLIINYFFVYYLHCSIADIIHLLYPQHLIFRFEFFRYIFFLGKLFYQPKKHILCLFVNIGKVAVQFPLVSSVV